MNLKTALKLEFAEPKTLSFDFLSRAKPPAKANRESGLSSNLIDRSIECSRGKRQRLKSCIHHLLRLSDGNLLYCTSSRTYK